ncbi:MAG: hypothetical protein IT382_19045 [Deltaproteobacteria bacterium]|nr:hypothetical protein [Deltaproteobacteria bacterium]
MSLDVVSKKIEVLSHQKVVKEADVGELVVSAERSVKGRVDGVSNAEARAVADFYVRTVSPLPVKAKIEVPVLDDGAVNKFDAFFMAHHLPYGKNKGPMKERILHALEGKPLGEPMQRAPRTGSLQPLRLSRQGEERRDAYLDVVKKQFVVRVGDGPEAKFFGPFPLE